MSFREMIRGILRDELSQINESTQLKPSPSPALSERTAHLAHLAELREQAQLIEARESEVDSDVRRIVQLQAEIDELNQRVQAHRSRLWCEKLDNSVAIDRELALLRSTCSPQITQFIEWANDEQARLMRLKFNEQWSYGEKNILVDNAPTPIHLFSNAPAIKRRLVAVVAARSRAEELKLLDRTGEELRSELEGLRSALPQIDGLLERVWS